MQRRYDYVFCLLPEADTHAGHKAATLLALDAVAALPAGQRPVVLGAALRNKEDRLRRFEGLSGYALTRTLSPLPDFATDRTVRFGFNQRINYKIIANWELAAHKSQGATQMTMNEGDDEEFWSFALNAPGTHRSTEELFSRLGSSPYQNAAPVITHQLALRKISP